MLAGLFYSNLEPLSPNLRVRVLATVAFGCWCYHSEAEVSLEAGLDKDPARAMLRSSSSGSYLLIIDKQPDLRATSMMASNTKVTPSLVRYRVGQKSAF